MGVPRWALSELALHLFALYTRGTEQVQTLTVSVASGGVWTP
eukprot:CAMPEP_0172765590 /NCGR_PEP_ID=MMETSP1074-20121228/179597_1 /TAXON_ID=2916 /ORGANISM="Ceratium fusus, Strain PA161109" /LENGTH=41 /DNA_ID= /DNA_START= /DNA_END= /DNA_ORIENTATION=